MSAFGPKRTSLVALHMSAIGGKADMPLAVGCLSSVVFDARVSGMIRLHRLTAKPKCGALLGNYPKWLVVLLFVAIALIEGPDFNNSRVPLGRISCQPMLSEGSGRAE